MLPMITSACAIYTLFDFQPLVNGRSRKLPLDCATLRCFALPDLRGHHTKVRRLQRVLEIHVLIAD